MPQKASGSRTLFCVLVLMATVAVVVVGAFNARALSVKKAEPSGDFGDLIYDEQAAKLALEAELSKQLLRRQQLLSDVAVEQSQQSGQINQQQNNALADDQVFIMEDKDFPKSPREQYPEIGQVSGLATLPSGHVAIFHRANKEWTTSFFLDNNTVSDQAPASSLIAADTILVIDGRDGRLTSTFGANLFHMPHGIASDSVGNLWVTDVGRHQVMRLPTGLMNFGPNAGTASSSAPPPPPNSRNKQNTRHNLPGNLSQIWPDIVLGEPFVPGADDMHFCKPSDVTVASDSRLVYIADGYCNNRVVVFTGAGRFVTSFGESHGIKIAHSLALLEEQNLVCVSDRDNSRILCFRAGLDGDLNGIGELVLVVNYPLGSVYAIAPIDANNLLVSSLSSNSGSQQREQQGEKFELAILNPFTEELRPAWISPDLLMPHSLATSADQMAAFVGDMSKSAFKKVYKFDIIHRKAPTA